MGMSESNLKLFMETYADGGRGKRRPRLEWINYIEKRAGLLQVKGLTQDKREYRKWLKGPRCLTPIMDEKKKKLLITKYVKLKTVSYTHLLNSKNYLLLQMLLLI